MSRSYFRPFTKILLMSTNQQNMAVDLVDSSGGALPCNFVSVDTSTGATKPTWVELHASSMTQWTGVPSGTMTIPRYASGGGDSVPLAEATSGTLGVGGSGLLMTACVGNGGTAQLPLGGGDSVKSVGLRLAYNPASIADNVLVILTYGNVRTGNTLKDDLARPRGV